MVPAGWLLGSAVLAVVSLGVGGVIRAALSVLLCVGGCLGMVYLVTEGKDDSEEDPSEDSEVGRLSWEKLKRTTLRTPAVPSLSPRLTGIAPLDGELHQILSYVLRDYVQSWQAELTHTNDFSTHVQEAAQVVISGLAARIRQVDWIPFLTTR